MAEVARVTGDRKQRQVLCVVPGRVAKIAPPQELEIHRCPCCSSHRTFDAPNGHVHGTAQCRTIRTFRLRQVESLFEYCESAIEPKYTPEAALRIFELPQKKNEIP
jgi:hypothetical protein